jgi:hypothetical protein
MSSSPSNTARRKFAVVHRLDKRDVSRLWMRSRIPSAAPPLASVGESTHSASTEACLRGLRRCSCAGSRRSAPAPLYFRAPLAPESCAHSSQLYTVAPAAAPRRAARSCLPSRRGHKRAPWMRPVQLVGGDAIRSSAFIARHRRRCQRRQLSLGATLPGVSEAIRIFGVRFFDQFTLTVAKPYIAFVAARGDTPTWSM